MVLCKMARNKKIDIQHMGVLYALGSAFLFGAGTPLAKLLLNNVSPWLLAGLLYLGSGIGLSLYRLISKAKPVRLRKSEIPWFLGAILAGGVIGPVCLMFGLSGMPASGASLLLNAEGVFTALLAWFAFKENVDKRVFMGMLAIVAGALFLSWSGEAQFAGLSSFLLILGACLAWAVDNNLTRKIALNDASWIAAAKGLVAGVVNLGLAMSLQLTWPPLENIIAAMVVGFFAYGVSLALFVLGLRHLGTARTGAYYSVAPFIGAILAVLMGEPVTVPLLIAGALMALGVWLHLTEKHEHFHIHETLEHDHEHVHDIHHQHSHDFPVAEGTRHKHLHKHEPIAHSHEHYPDAHHQHRHKS